MDPTNRQTDLYLSPADLRVGLHIHLDLPWFRHPFGFSSFKIRDAGQIEQLRALGLTRIRCSPLLSDGLVPDLASDSALPPHAASPEVTTADAAPACDEKRRQLDAMAAHRARLQRCEQDMARCVRQLADIDRHIFARPEQAHADALDLVSRLADSMLVEADLAVHLMSDRLDGEDAYRHPLNVTLLAMMLGRLMRLTGEEMRLLGLGALFHDIGKLDLPDRVVRKPEPLTPAEHGVLEQHCALGVELGAKLRLPAEALIVIAQHHEYLDGTGYPKRLQGMQLHLLSRVVCVANAYDKLCNPPVLRQALSPHEALSTMYGKQRNRFDATPMNTLVRCMGVYPPGTLVGLSNGLPGMVVGVNGSRPLKPTVKVCEPGASRAAPVIVNLEREPDVSVVRTLRPHQLDAEERDYLSPPRRMAYFFDTEPADMVAG